MAGAFQDLEAKEHKFSAALLGATLLLALALKALTKTEADPDLWGYLAFGRLFWETGNFPYHDIFSYVPTLPRWVYHEWLTGVLFYPLYQTLGAAGLQLFKYGMGLATLGLLYLTAQRRGVEVFATLLVLIVILVPLSFGFSPVRDQVFTYLFFALTLYLLETARQTGRWRRLFLLVPLQVFWCNVHGGFLSGLGMIFIYALGEGLSRRSFLPYVAILFLSGLATLINPYGLEYWQYLFHAISMPRPEITEWQSLYEAFQTQNVVSLLGLIYILLAAFIFIVLGWWARWRDLTPILAFGLTLYLAIRHLRHEPFFLLVIAAYTPLLMTAFFQKIQANFHIAPRFGRLGLKIAACLILIFVATLGYKIVKTDPLSLTLPAQPSSGNPNLKTYYPVRAVEYIRNNKLSGNLLAFFQWGEYLIWSLYPQCKVAIDGRYETVYSDEVCKEFFDFIYARGNWKRFLEHYPPDMILVNCSSGAYSRLTAEPDWQLVFHDTGSALFVKRGKFPPVTLKGKS